MVIIKTHLCQPLDLAFFSPLKTVWRRLLTDWKMKFKGSIRKDHFPRLLKSTLNELGQNASENLIAGFKKSGIAPLDRNKILKRLPQEVETSEDLSRDSWTSTFKEYLKETRENQTKVNPRKKKITVTPGKSLTEGNVMEELALKELDTNKKRGSEQKSVNNEGEKKRRTVDTNTAEIKDVATKITISVGDFILVEYIYDVGKKNESKKTFIGKVISKKNDRYNTSFMRNYKGSTNILIFPDVEDIDVGVQHQQILKVLKLKTENRGKYTFDYNMSK